MSRQNLFTGIDIGSTMIRVAIGVKSSSGLRMTGYAEGPSRGVRRGIVVNAHQLTESLNPVLESAERMSGKKVTEATVNVNGAQVRVKPVQASINIDVDSEVTGDDISRLFEVAAQRGKRQNGDILQIFSKGYSADGAQTKNPIGLDCSNLSSELNVVTASTMGVDLIDAAMDDLDLSTIDKTLSAISAGQTILSEAQNETGAVVIDVGYYTTNIAIFEDGDLVAAKVIPVGSAQITNDLAIGLKLSIGDAEMLKVSANLLGGNASKIKASTKMQVEVVEDEAPRQIEVPKKLALEVARARTEELFEICDEFVKTHANISNLAGGVALIGGGSQQQGISELCSEVMDLPVFVAGSFHNGISADLIDGGFSLTSVAAVSLMTHHSVLAENDVDIEPKSKKKSRAGKKKGTSKKLERPGSPSVSSTLVVVSKGVGKGMKSVATGLYNGSVWILKRMAGKK